MGQWLKLFNIGCCKSRSVKKLEGRWASVKVEDEAESWYVWHVVAAADGAGKGVTGSSWATRLLSPAPICPAPTACAKNKNAASGQSRSSQLSFKIPDVSSCFTVKVHTQQRSYYYHMQNALNGIPTLALNELLTTAVRLWRRQIHGQHGREAESQHIIMCFYDVKQNGKNIL